MSQPLPLKPNPLTSSTRRVATPLPSGSSSRQMLGCEATYRAPSCQSTPCGKHEPIGEDRAGVELAVAVDVFQAEDAAQLLLAQLGAGKVRARALGDVEPALVVEGREQRVADQRRPRHFFHDKPGRDPEVGGLRPPVPRLGHAPASDAEATQRYAKKAARNHRW